MVISQSLHLFFDQLLRLILQKRIKRGVNRETRTEDGLRVIALLQLRANIVDPMGKTHSEGDRFEIVIGDFRRRHTCLLGRDTNGLRIITNVNAALLSTGCCHEGKYLPMSIESRFTVRKNVIYRGRLDQTCQEGGLRQGEVFCSGIEVSFCCCLNAIRHIAEIGLI